MEVSYYVYNNPDTSIELPSIPGDFMGEFTTPVTDILGDYYFEDITAYNYASDDCGAHVIAHRNIKFTDNQGTQTTNINGGIESYDYGMDDGFAYGNEWIYTEHAGHILYDNIHTKAGTEGGYSTALQISTNMVEESEESNYRPLVVVDIRGSVTTYDWIYNILTQLYPFDNKFEDMKNVVVNNLESYLSNNNIEDPIVLVTGHSLGAAIANLLAADLNISMGIDNVYAYTFATPQVVTESLGGEAIPYTNIYNILNSNDVITYVPSTLAIPMVNFWERHGIDLPINMPYSKENDVDSWGIYCHSMAVYMNWMTENPNLTFEEISAESSESTVRGLLPIIVKVKCPVGVTIKDSEGNIIAYESQEENTTYPEVVDAGVTSWVTDDGAKMFFIPHGANATDIEIKAYDYGTMDFAIEIAGNYIEDDVKVFNDVSLYPDKEFLVEISEEVPTENTQLFVTENGEIVGEVTETDPHLKSVTVTHEERTNNVVTYLTFVTDNSVSEIQFYKIGGNSTSYIFPTSSHVTVVEDGDNLIWTAGYVYNTAGDYSYDVSVKSGDEWYYYENVFSVHIPQEYIDIGEGTLETSSFNANSEDESYIYI